MTEGNRRHQVGRATDLQGERERIRAEYARRAREVGPDRYAAWRAEEALARASRVRHAASLLNRAGAFPGPHTPCLEVGCGTRGWLPDLLAWGVRESALHGLDLDDGRIAVAREALPAADLRTGDAAALPFADGAFGLVVASTMFTSILDNGVRALAAREIVRVLHPGGALVWYDFAVDNPFNKAVRGIPRAELRRLFPSLRAEIRTATLAPPLARLVTPVSYTLAVVLEAIPPLRTHLVAVLVKRRDDAVRERP